MNIKTGIFNLRKYTASVDWKLLIFLVLFLNVKIAVKVLAVIIIYLLRFNFKLGFSVKNSRLPLFYLLAIIIASFNILIYGNFRNINYDLVFLCGISFWVLSILAIHQIKIAVEKNDVETLHRTIVLFFLINALVSIFNLAHIMWEIKTLNPYLYQGMYQKYFIGTGDYIKGLTFDVAITNSVINAFAVIYFLYKKNGAMLLLCMAVLLLTGSNSLNIIAVVIFCMVFIFQSNRDQKSLIMVCFGLMIVFMFKISPQNSDYIARVTEMVVHKKAEPIKIANTNAGIIQLPDSSLNEDKRKEKIANDFMNNQYRLSVAAQPIINIKAKEALTVKHAIPAPDINTAPFWEATDTTEIQRTLLNFISEHKSGLPVSSQNKIMVNMPGKAIALCQTVTFLLYHPQKILTGNGLGNFSSKIAFKATSLGINGGYIKKYAYINKDFLSNHLDIYLNFFSKKAGLHSVINNPNSVFLQLAGEYGLLGLAVFVVFYLGYFLEHYKKLSYGIPLLAIVLGVFWFEYWFEQLSVVIMFELMLFLNIKEGEKLTHKAELSHAN